VWRKHGGGGKVTFAVSHRSIELSWIDDGFLSEHAINFFNFQKENLSRRSECVRRRRRRTIGPWFGDNDFCLDQTTSAKKNQD
jgi:hypothetical protein